MMDIMIIFYVIGVVCGCAIMQIRQSIKRREPVGTLRVDSSDPDGPYLFLELETEPSFITKEKTVLLKVDTKSYLSQQ